MTGSDVHRHRGYLLTSADSGGPLPESLAPQDGIGPCHIFEQLAHQFRGGWSWGHSLTNILLDLGCDSLSTCGDRVPFWGDGNILKLIIVMTAQLREHANQWTVF